ncbi:MAG: phosphate ABC transporter permease PstA [Ignavibacteriales bacterium]|nr:phosphate ABC transporter permease PstA [Ignavibacteriales bacterium]
MKKKLFHKNSILGFLVVGGTGAAAVMIITSIVLVMVNIIAGGMNNISWAFLTESPKEGMTAGGIYPAIVGTFLRVLVMSIIGVPIGATTAIYLSEYASSRSVFARMIRFAVNTLAGVPAIVFGLFGLGFFVQFVGSGMDNVLNPGQLHWAQPNLLWASLTMALLTLPVVIVSVEEAIKTVPRELREASLALGATKWQTIRKVVIPNSITGVLTGGILAVGRGAGEVAPILFTGAAYFLPRLPQSFSDQFMELGYHIYIMATQSSDVEATRGIQFATTLVLLVFTFSLNFIAVYLRYKMRKRISTAG